MRKVCTYCRHQRAMVRPYLVFAYEGDRHPVEAKLCKPCAMHVIRGRAKLEAVCTSRQLALLVDRAVRETT